MTPTVEALLRRNEALRRRLEEAEETLRAIRAGEVDAVLVESGLQQVYTLETAENSYRLLVARVPHAAVTITEEGSIVACNSRFADLLERLPDSLRGHPIQDFVAPDSFEALETLLRAGRTAEAEGIVTLLRGKGVRHSAWLGVSALDEGVLGSCLMVTDLTERRHYEQLQRAQEALRESEKRYRTLFESIDEGFCLIQVLFDEAGRPSDYRFLETNPSFEQQTGLSEVIGRTMRQLEPLHEEYWFQIYGRVAQTGESIRFQNRAEALHRWYDVYAFRTGDPSEGKVAILFSDISERKRAVQALQEADRMKDEFLATLAHELRNPLAPIRNVVQVLKAKGPSAAELEWSLGVIDRQTQVMGRLLEDLLDVSRISRAQLELRKERVELAAVVEAAIETSRPFIEAGGHTLTVTLPPVSTVLDADPVRLSQVFANLLNNAAKYGEPGGPIRVTAERQGNEVAVSVKDTGIGIPAEMLPRIFTLFSQVKSALPRSQGGAGIGLWLAKGLVELHGGSMEARSAGIGQGAEFAVRLPVAAKAHVRKTARPAVAEEPLPLRRLRVLIVDDHRDSADSLAILLKEMGHEVATAYDGEHAVEAAGTLRPDVALLDIGMPGLDGYGACRRIREQPWGKDIVLIALTGWGQEKDRRRTREAGFNGHIVKPLDSIALKKLLMSLSSEKVPLTDFSS